MSRRGLRVPPVLATCAALALLLIVIALRHPRLMNARFASNLVNDHAVLGLAACGAAIVLIAGSIDLSLGAVMALSSTVLATLLRSGVDPVAATALVFLLGATFGAAHGALITRLAVPPFIATLAGMFLARGLALKLAAGPITIDSASFVAWGEADLRFGGGAKLTLLGGSFIALVVLLELLLRKTPAGRNLYATGGNAHAAELLGVRPRRVVFGAHVSSGACAAAAGVAFALFGSSGNPAEGVGLELEAIAAAVIGGVALTGGRGSVAGAALGVITFAAIRTLLLAEGGFDAGTYRVAVGALLLVFLVIQRPLAAGRH